MWQFFSVSEEPSRLKELLQGAVKVLNSEVTGVKFKVPGVGDVGVASEKEKFSLTFGIGENQSGAGRVSQAFPFPPSALGE